MVHDPVTVATASPGWYADPWRQATWRWWDGNGWTAYTSAPEDPRSAINPNAVTRGAPAAVSGSWVRSTTTPGVNDANATLLRMPPLANSGRD